MQPVAGGTRGDVRVSAEGALTESKVHKAKWLDDAWEQAFVAARGTGLEPRVGVTTERGVYEIRKIG